MVHLESILPWTVRIRMFLILWSEKVRHRRHLATDGKDQNVSDPLWCQRKYAIESILPRRVWIRMFLESTP